MKTSQTSADLWSNAYKRVNAESGMGDPVDAISYVPAFSVELAALNRGDPEALGRLAARADLTDAQRLKVLQTYTPKETAKVKAAKTKPKAKPPARSRFSHLSAARLGFGKGARS